MQLKIYIRKRYKDDVVNLSPQYEKQKNLVDLIELYDGLYRNEYEKMKNEDLKDLIIRLNQKYDLNISRQGNKRVLVENLKIAISELKKGD